MKRIVACALMFLFFSMWMPSGQALPMDIMDRKLKNVNINEPNLRSALSAIAVDPQIPIGFEDSSETEEGNEQTVVIHMQAGTVRDLLNFVISVRPKFEWRVIDEVINVFPAKERDTVLQELLDVSVSRFSIVEGDSRLKIRNALATLPEVNTVLAAKKLQPFIVATNSIDFEPAGPGLSLQINNVTLPQTLNVIIQRSNAKYWEISRFGKQNKLLIINL